MSPHVQTWFEMILRWSHFLLGFAWIGHLFFLTYVQIQLTHAFKSGHPPKYVPGLLPRALYWYRTSSIFAWISGFILLFVIYYQTGIALRSPDALGPFSLSAVVLVLLAAGFGLYDIVWKVCARRGVAGVLLSTVLLAGITFSLSRVLTMRAVYIHIGALLGTILTANVLLRIQPGQRSLVAAIKAGTAPDAALVETALMRTKHNNHLAIPLAFTMISHQYPTIYGMTSWDGEAGWVVLVFIVAIAYLIPKNLSTIFKGVPSPGNAPRG
jgi:uncharacterized membrane protein